jgi:hypothetical protein
LRPDSHFRPAVGLVPGRALYVISLVA